MPPRTKQEQPTTKGLKKKRKKLIEQLKAADSLRINKQYIQSFKLFNEVISQFERRPLENASVAPSVVSSGWSSDDYHSKSEFTPLVEAIERHLNKTDADDSPASDASDDESELLTLEQLNWARTHAAVAATNAYTTYQDQEFLLYEARRLLTDALRSVKNHTKAEAWTWAQLGEAYRKLGNLSSFYYDSSQLFARSGLEQYHQGAVCFLMALTLDRDFSWAKAHFGALILNRRRYYPKRSTALRDTSIAFEVINEAVKHQQHTAAWSTDYLSIAHFVRAVYKLLFHDLDYPHADERGKRLNFKKELQNAIAQLLHSPGGRPHRLHTRETSTPEHTASSSNTEALLCSTRFWPGRGLLRRAPRQATETPVQNLVSFSQDILVSLYYSIVLWHSSPSLLQNPVQPGAMEVDITFAMLYDFSVLLPYADKDAKSSVIKAMLDLAHIGAALPKGRAYVPHVFDITQLYFVVLVQYIACGLTPADADSTRQHGDNKARHLEQVLNAAEKLQGFAKTVLELPQPLSNKTRLPAATSCGLRAGVLSIALDMLKTCVILRLLNTKDLAKTTKKKVLERLHGLHEVLQSYDVLLDLFAHGETARTATRYLCKCYQELTADVDPSSSQSLESAFRNRAFWILSPTWSFGTGESLKFVKKLEWVLNFRPDQSMHRAWSSKAKI